jgi:hypothetical protein
MKNKYTLYKFTTIFMSSLLVPVGTFIGYEFGIKNYTYALAGLVFQTVFVFIQEWIWWIAMERMEKKQ